MRIRSAALLALAACAPSQPRPSPPPPDIVFILADDLGCGDVGCYASPDVRTPAIDRLAAQGVRFRQFYSNGPECTPTRTAFLTGRYQQRVGGLECALGVGNVGRYDDAIRLQQAGELGLPVSETSLARLLKDAGYATALLGKWHLGYEPKFFPGPHGFDEWFGPLGGGVDYFHHTEPDGAPVLFRDGRRITREGYLTDLLADDAVAYLGRPHERPFFLYLPFTAPHSPYQGPGDRRDAPLTDAEWNRGTRAKYVEMVERLDHAVGRILAALEAAGRARNAIVVFASDNGADPRGSNAPFSGHKGTTFEGGIRVPCVVRWPGVLPEGAVSDRVGLTLDLTVSLARAGGAKPSRPFDGIDLLAAEAAGGPPSDRVVFWRGRRADRTWRAVRHGDLKYRSREDGGRLTEERLFDLKTDVAEAHDLLAARPAEAERLRGLLRAWEERVRPVR
jgi:N-acetylgalactosamine-6-sulfatase